MKILYALVVRFAGLLKWVMYITIFLVLYALISARAEWYAFVDASSLVENNVNIDNIVLPKSKGVVSPVSNIRKISEKHIIYPVIVSTRKPIKTNTLYILVFNLELKLVAEIKYDEKTYEGMIDKIALGIHEDNGVVYYPGYAKDFKSHSGIAGHEFISDIDIVNPNLKLIVHDEENNIVNLEFINFYEIKHNLMEFDGLYDEILMRYKSREPRYLESYAFSKADLCYGYIIKSMVMCSKYRYDFNVSDNTLRVDIKKLSIKNSFVDDSVMSLGLNFLTTAAMIPINPFGVDSIEHFHKKNVEIKNFDQKGKVLVVNSSMNGFLSNIHKHSGINTRGELFVYKDKISGFKRETSFVGTPLQISDCIYIASIIDDEEIIRVKGVLKLNMCKLTNNGI